jgi:hypothetical protein
VIRRHQKLIDRQIESERELLDIVQGQRHSSVETARNAVLAVLGHLGKPGLAETPSAHLCSDGASDSIVERISRQIYRHGGKPSRHLD